MSSAVIFQIQSTLIVGLFIFGLSQRKNRKVHIPVMATAIIWDILLVLQIELTRSAIGKAIKVTKNPELLNFHVSVAVLTVFLYIFMGRTGYLLKKHQMKPKNLHRAMGFLTIFCRLTTYVTSFFIVD